MSIFFATAVIVAGGVFWYINEVQREAEFTQKQIEEQQNKFQEEIWKKQEEQIGKDEISNVQDLIDEEYVFKPVDTSNWQTYRNEEIPSCGKAASCRKAPIRG